MSIPLYWHCCRTAGPSLPHRDKGECSIPATSAVGESHLETESHKVVGSKPLTKFISFHHGKPAMKRLPKGFSNVTTLVFSPCGLCEGLGLSSTTDWMSGRSLTTIRGGRSLWRTAGLCWLGVDVWPTCSSSPSLSVSDASPGTLQRPG